MSLEIERSRNQQFNSTEYWNSVDAFACVRPVRLNQVTNMSEMAVHVMSSKILHEQLSIIMGALTKAAVTEICEVFDEGYAVLQLEITRSHKENEDLRKKLHLIESIIVRGNGGKAATPADEPAVPDVEATDQQDTAREGEGTSTGDGCNNANVTARELPDVVLIKDEDSDSNETYEEGVKPSADGGTGVAVAREGASPVQFRSKKRNWPRNEEGGSQCERKKTAEQHTLKSSVSKLSFGKQKKVASQYTLDVPCDDEPGCSSQSGGDEKEATESMCSYTSQMDPDVQLVSPECPLVPTLSNTNRQAYFGGLGNDALIESQSQTNKAELDLSLTWSKQCKPQMAFTQFNQNESIDNEPFGLKLINVTGSTSTDCQMSESSNSAFEFDDADMMNFAMYRDQSNRPQHCNGQSSVNAKGKRFICPICNKTYATSQNLDVHIRIHTGERPFSCGQCGKKFTQSAHLKSHLSVHSGERPYSCALCSKSFIVKYSLKLHMKKCHSTA